MSNTITPSQVAAALQLQGSNGAVANQILSGSQLTGINLAALGVLLKNEVGGNIGQAYSVSPPLSGAAKGNSGWTVGITQLDFNTNSTAAQTLLSTALTRSGAYSASTSQQIAQAFVAAGTSPTVSLPSGVTLSQVNAALGTQAATAVINQNADQSTTGLINNINSVVSQLTNSTVQQQLTPGNPNFNATAYLSLVDYANQFGGISTPSGQYANSSHPMFDYLNTGTATFPGGSPISSDPTQDLAVNVESAEFATKYANPNGIPNPAAANVLGNRQNTQDAVGAAYNSSNGLQSNNDSGTSNYGDGENLTLSDPTPGYGDYLASYVQQRQGQPISKQGWIQVANSGQFATDTSTYNSSGSETGTTFQTGSQTSGVQETAQVNFGVGAGSSSTVQVTQSGVRQPPIRCQEPRSSALLWTDR